MASISNLSSKGDEEPLKAVYIVIGGPGSRKEYLCRLISSVSEFEYLNREEADENTCKSTASNDSSSEQPFTSLEKSMSSLRLAILKSPKNFFLM